jgi:ATP synthase protein I
MVDDARILVRSAIAVAVTGLVLVVVGAIMVGGKGALGAGLGVALVAAFFTLSVVTVSLAERWWGPTAMTAAALGTFLVKVIAVMAVVAAFRDTSLFDTRIFGLAAIVGILIWCAGQVVTLARRRVLYVEPDSESR